MSASITEWPAVAHFVTRQLRSHGSNGSGRARHRARFLAFTFGGLSAPAFVVRFAAFVLGIVSVLRAVGDFRLVGVFKTVRGTKIAANDTRWFSPLCVAIGIATLWPGLPRETRMRSAKSKTRLTP